MLGGSARKVCLVRVWEDRQRAPLAEASPVDIHQSTVVARSRPQRALQTPNYRRGCPARAQQGVARGTPEADIPGAKGGNQEAMDGITHPFQASALGGHDPMNPEKQHCHQSL